MASLDDFFAKRDKKKGKGKKFTTTDEIAKKLEESGKKVEKAEVKPKKDRPKGDDENNVEVSNTEVGEEWKDYKEEGEKDYSGLKIQKLNINEAEDEPEGEHGEGAEGDAPVSRNVWKMTKEGEEAEQQQEQGPTPEPEPVPVPKPAETAEPEASAASQPRAYRPPHARDKGPGDSKPAATAPVRGRPRVAPDINSEEYFPSLSLS